MNHPPNTKLPNSMRTSPWIILGSTFILLVVVIVLAVQNTRREKHAMTTLLRAKGEALIRAMEAGTRTGMMGMRWGGRQIQKLLEETGHLPDVVYVAVLDEAGIAVAHSDPAKARKPFRFNGWQPRELTPEFQDDWELLETSDNGRVFEVYRYFRPMMRGPGPDGRHRRKMMRRGRVPPDSQGDWFSRQQRQRLFIVVGLDTADFEQAIRKDIQTTLIISAALLLLGFGGFVSLFWLNSYRVTKRTLQDTSAFADEVVAHLPVGLIATDADGRITFFNAAAERITRLNAAEAANARADLLLPAQLVGLKRGLEDGHSIGDKEINCTFSDGHTVPLSVSATGIVNAAGQRVGHILILRDLGEVRRLQHEVRRQENLAAIGGLAAGVAHEIRNPLSSIKGLATFFHEQFEAGSEAQTAAVVMADEVDRLNRVISELLDLSRPTDIKPRSTRLATLLSHSLQLIRQDTTNAGIRVAVEIEDDICTVWVDPDRLTQCLLNLYLNAIQAMSTGGTLSLSCKPDGATHVRLVVSDTGKGIPDDHIDQIFNPYFTTKGKGTGLGLAIVHKIVEAHNGRITVESAHGKGSAFTLRLPCHEDQTV